MLETLSKDNEHTLQDPAAICNHPDITVGEKYVMVEKQSPTERPLGAYMIMALTSDSINCIRDFTPGVRRV
jgi:hypothetical protein